MSHTSVLMGSASGTRKKQMIGCIPDRMHTGGT
jgi:hypothetical protein